MKKLLHYFVSHNGQKRRWLVPNDYCIYCKSNVQDLWDGLPEVAQLENKKAHGDNYLYNNIDYLKDDCKFFNKYSSCICGITEEEMMIKGIIE